MQPQPPPVTILGFRAAGRATVLALSSDRTRGRFFGPDVVDAARIEEVDADCMSDEDTVAVLLVLFDYDSGKQGYEVGIAECLMRTQQAGSTRAFENVQQLNISDPCGLAQMHWFAAVMDGQVQRLHDGERACDPKKAVSVFMAISSPYRSTHFERLQRRLRWSIFVTQVQRLLSPIGGYAATHASRPTQDHAPGRLHKTTQIMSNAGWRQHADPFVTYQCAYELRRRNASSVKMRALTAHVQQQVAAATKDNVRIRVSDCATRRRLLSDARACSRITLWNLFTARQPRELL